MMEAMQISPAAFGPMAPGMGGGHGNTIGRGISGLQDIFSKTGSVELTSREGAQNTLTDMAEFKWGDIFMTFNYQNKGGKLFANGRPIENINDADEIGGDRMGRVLDALNHMTTDQNIEESIVVSEDLGYGRHFIYRYRRGEGDTIEGLAFEYQGSTAELSEVVHQLGRRAISSQAKKDQAIDFGQPLFFSEENKNSVEDLAVFARGSFKTQERKQQMKSYLTRLDRDTTQFDQLMKRRQMQEDEIAKQFKEIILGNENAKVGIAAAVYGAINIAEKMVIKEDRRREEIEGVQVIQKMESKSDGTYRIVKLKDENSISIDPPAVSSIPLPATKDETKPLRLDKAQYFFSRPNVAKEDKMEEEIVSIPRLLKPIVPGVIGFVNIIVNYGQEPETKVTGIKESSEMEIPSVDLKVVESQVNELEQSHFRLIDPYFDNEFPWEEFIRAIFIPGSKESTDKESFYDLQVNLVGIDLISYLHADKIHESSPSEKKGEITLLTNWFQQGLEVIAKLSENSQSDKENKNGVDKEEIIRQNKVEAELVKLGGELVGALLRDKNILKSLQDPELNLQIDPIAQLSFLLDVYQDQNSSNEMKRLVAALIYMQIEIMEKDRLFIDKFPQLKLLFQQFSELSPKSNFLRVRFLVVIETLEKLTNIKILNNIDGMADINTLLKKVYVLIYMLFMRRNKIKSSFKDQIIFSHELLINSQKLKSKFISPKKKRNNKSQKQFFSCGIIYQYHYTIAYKAIFVPE